MIFELIMKKKPSFTNDDSLRKNALSCIEKDCRTLDNEMSKLGPCSQSA